jgi:hypothetical protein
MAFMGLNGKLATALLSFVISSANSPRPLTSTIVSLPKTGPVSVSASVRQDDYPRLVFRSVRTGKVLLNTQVGEGDYWKEFVLKDDPHHLDMEIRFLVLHRAGLPDPLIVALAKRYGGSDCGLDSALIGDVGGRLSELTPSLPDFFLRGGLFLSGANGNGPITLTVTSERYQWEKDVHYMGPSRMAVYVYTYDSSQGRFVETRQTEVNSNDLRVSGENLTELFGEFATC